MKRIYFLMCLLLPIFARGYTANIYLTSGCTNAVLVTGFVLGDYPVYDTEPFSFVCNPGDSNVLQTVVGNGPDQGISVNGSYYPFNTVYVSADCSFPPTLGTQPDDTNDFSNDDDFWDQFFDSDCQGMPKYKVSEPYLSLWLHDEPLGYQPASGPRLSFRLDYDQREAVAGYNKNWFSFGKKWNSAWLGYVTRGVDVNNNPYNVVHFPGGGSQTYYSNNVVDILTSTYLNGNTNAGFSVFKEDGSADVYGFIVTNSNGAFEEAFMTQHVNPQGQSLTFNYYNYNPGPAAVIRLQSVVDADGRTNLIGYNTTASFSSNLITQVTDPFNRTSFLTYSTGGDLIAIADVAGNSTVLGYDTNDWVTNMVTPYGTNTFAITDNGTKQVNITRSILITRPDNSHELYLNEDMAPGATDSFTSGIVPNTSPYNNTFGNYDLNYHNTYYWGPRQYANLSTANVALFTANDFLKARMRHWLTQRGTFYPSGTLSIERDPSPDNLGDTAGQTMWYDYPGKSAPDTQGNWLQPSLVARVLPDGTTAFNYYVRNPFGLVATNASTYSLGAGGVGVRMTTYAYAANNIDLIAITNALNVCVSSNWFNGTHQPLVSYDALGQKTSFIYNANHQLTETIYPNGLTVTNNYGPFNLLTSTITVGYLTNTFTYIDDLIRSETDSRGLTISNTWDNLSRLTGTSYPDGSSISNVYNVLDLTATRDRQGNWTRYGYDQLERLRFLTNALGSVKTYDYCPCGALESIVDAETNMTQFFYDNQGNRTNVTYADNYSVTSTYNLLRQVTSTTDTSGDNVTNAYNNQGLLVSSANSAGVLIANTYDALDRITNGVNSNHVGISTVYDNLNRVLSRTYPDNSVEAFGYSINYRSPTSYTNQITNIVQYAYDLEGRKTNEKVLGVTSNTFAFDGPGDLLTLTDGNNDTTTWIYDQYGRVTNKLDAVHNLIFAYKYDSDSRLTNRWTPATGNTAYGYDAVGNLTNISYLASPAISLTYDALNRLTTMVDAVGTSTYGYDAVGQLLKEDGPWPSDTVNYSYANRLRTSMSVQAPNAGPWIQSYGYDYARRMTGVTSPVGTFAYHYDPVELLRIDVLNLPGGNYITNAYDNVARQTLAELVNAQGINLDSYAYGYDLAGQVTKVTRAAGDYVNYTYDNEGELKTGLGKAAGGTTNRWQEQFGYSYDAAGNLSQRTNNTLLQSFSVNSLNELTIVSNNGALTVVGSTTSPATDVTVNASSAVLYADTTFASTNQSWVSGNNTYTAVAEDAYGRSSSSSVTVNLQATNGFSYDLNGNLISDGSRNFTYDDENELIGVCKANNYSNNFVYDGKMRRRIERDYQWNAGTSSWIETNEIHFIYDGNAVVQERNASNIPLVTYTRGNNLSEKMKGAVPVVDLLARTDMGQWFGGDSFASAFYHTDGNGNVTCLCYENGSLAAKYLYDSFGNTLAQYGSLASANNYRFSSKEWNANSGLYYHLYRFYDPNLQRWLNRDPIAEKGGVNIYTYVGNRPLEFVDRLGEKQLPPDPSAGNGNGSGSGNQGGNGDMGGNDNGWETVCEWLQDQISELEYEQSQLAVLGSCLDPQSEARLEQLRLLFEEYCIDPFNKPDRSYDPVEPYDVNDCSTCEVNNPAPPIDPPRAQTPEPQNVLPPPVPFTPMQINLIEGTAVTTAAVGTAWYISALSAAGLALAF